MLVAGFITRDKLISSQYIKGPLTKERGLDTAPSEKPTMSFEDFTAIVHYHWQEDTNIFPTERQRVQFAFIVLFIAYTGSRPGALLQGNGDPEDFKGILYRDFHIVMLRDPENTARTRLVLRVVLHHMKGREHQKEAYVHSYISFVRSC